ncbi:MAG: prepilin-type N-terminal cleavage/methylation domain-containing protein [Candidatus Omnitrophica bacterium]|nr:prepilin-type N-terminal cleavage/methylation domain-containing protein [Candidatus Omnitrophota bacterium]
MRKSGFTLIEIIIVIVILGVLASLAVPRLVAQIEASSSAEAMQMLGVIKRAFVSCVEDKGDAALCLTATDLGVVATAGNRFTYKTRQLSLTSGLVQAHRMINGVDNSICMWVQAAIGSEAVAFGVHPADSVYNPMIIGTQVAVPGNIWFTFPCNDLTTTPF